MPDSDAKLSERRAAYKSVFNKGKNATTVLADLAQFCHADRPTFVPGSPDATAFNEGKRRVLLRILGMTSNRGETLARIQQLTADNTDELLAIVEEFNRE